MSSTIAALYVDAGGVYCGLPGVEPWDRARDARKYAGPHPVVAHPPCQLWVNLTGVNFTRYGGVHNRPGNDNGCFARALECVRRFSGVLEHPAGSFAWSTFALLRPTPGAGWGLDKERGEWTCEVWQSAYGHRARKRTWLLYVGAEDPAELNWDQTPGTHQVGWFDRSKPTLSKREASATPVPFRDLLIQLARTAGQREGLDHE